MSMLVPDTIYRVFDRFMRDYDEYRIRRLKRQLKYCGSNVFISPKSVILSESQVELGNDVCINSFTHIFGAGGVVVSDGAMISSSCSILTINHPVGNKARAKCPHLTKSVHIGMNVWLGASVVILPGVTIGDHAVVGAGAVVTKDVPAFTVVVGNPAKVLRHILFE